MGLNYNWHWWAEKIDADDNDDDDDDDHDDDEEEEEEEKEEDLTNFTVFSCKPSRTGTVVFHTFPCASSIISTRRAGTCVSKERNAERKFKLKTIHTTKNT